MRDINVTTRDGIELAVRDHGGVGPDVLLMHGGTRTLLDWTLVLPHLNGVRVVTMDLRWHGQSDDGVDRFRWDELIGDIDDVTKTVAMDNPYVVGHSFGGSLAGSYAAAHPDCPGAINLDGYELDRPEIYDGVELGEAEEFVRQMQDQRKTFVPETDVGDGAWRDERVETMQKMEEGFGFPPELAREAAERCVKQASDGMWHLRPPRRFHDEVWADGAMPDVIETVASVTCPYLFVKCEQASTAPPPAKDFFEAATRGVIKAVRRLAETKPNLRLETIDSSHFVIFERPEESAELITSFISS